MANNGFIQWGWVLVLIGGGAALLIGVPYFLVWLFRTLFGAGA